MLPKRLSKGEFIIDILIFSPQKVSTMKSNFISHLSSPLKGLKWQNLSFIHLLFSFPNAPVEDMTVCEHKDLYDLITCM